jgi:chemotaxis protein methyltransferase WspC
MKTTRIIAPGILDRLQQAIGVDPQGLEAARLRWIVEARCRALKLPDPAAYAAYLEHSETEIDALIDAVVVQETRFFRDPQVFDHIRAAITQLAAATTGPLRLLSAPCGTGEEAYSLAATIQLLGLPLSRFTIDAFDISQSALEAAQRGVYPDRALKHLPSELQQALGQSTPQPTWTIAADLRDRIHFERRNLAAPGILGDVPQYHLILCRNLFIYLTPAARASLAKSLSNSLLPEGRLFLGTADRVEELTPYFAPMRPAASFGFTHRPPAPALAAEPHTPVLRLLSRLRFGNKPASQPRPLPADTQAESHSHNLIAANELYARALAHRQHGETAKAERRCRQALYLEPNLLPALELLQSLWDENPNLRLRRALRDRILRNRLARKESA